MNALFRTQAIGARAGKAWVVVLAVACLSAFPCGASVVNGSFGSGLSGWTVAGDVQAATEATLADSQADYSLLFQGVALGPGEYCLDFDFQNLLSDAIPTDPSAFPDAFFASLYFIDNLAAFDLAGSVFDGVDALMDLDATGPYNVAGTLSASVLGPGWTHFQMNFTNNYAYVIPVFELFNFNGVSGDSAVRIDNVEIGPPCTVIPEPATLTLCALGLAGYAAARRRRA